MGEARFITYQKPQTASPSQLHRINSSILSIGQPGRRDLELGLGRRLGHGHADRLVPKPMLHEIVP